MPTITILLQNKLHSSSSSIVAVGNNEWRTLIYGSKGLHHSLLELLCIYSRTIVTLVIIAAWCHRILGDEHRWYAFNLRNLIISILTRWRLSVLVDTVVAESRDETEKPASKS